MDIDKDAGIVLPKTAEFSDATSKIVYDDVTNDTVGTIEYTYAGHEVGKADIVKTNVQVPEYKFSNQTDVSEEAQTEETEHVSKIQIRMSTIITVVVVVLVLLVLGIIIKKVAVIPGMFSAFNMLVIRTYMNGISDSLEESAQLDGAGYTTIFLKIISPLCKPVYATVALFVAVGQWNSWFDAMLYNRMSANLTTLQYELMKLLSSVTNQGNSVEAMKNAAGSVTPTSVRAAATILTMLPIICLYPFLQRYFVTGLTIGGVKE